MLRSLTLAAMLTLAPQLCFAQAGAPKIMVDRARMMANTCTSMGGKPANGDRPFVYNQIDLNGDGKNDWVMDSAGFGCNGKPNLFVHADGATLEIFVGDGAGGARSAFIGTAYTYRVTSTKPAKIYITQRGLACGRANATCEKALNWNAATKKFVLGPATAPPLVAAAPQISAGAAPSAVGGFSGPAFTIAAADRTAAFKAAGFRLVGGKWRSACDDPGEPSYDPGAIEVDDLNKDGRPEIWITEGGTYCYGNTGQAFWLMAKTSAGQWTQLAQAIGVQVKKPTSHNGWADIEIGGPGMGPFPVMRFNGAKYR